MYIPKYYEMKDYQNVKDFITANNFATIVTNHESTPTATHLPLNIEEKENSLYLSGHFAKANKQWQTIDGNDKILIIFSGAHGYISSTWYETEDVPTWDYQSVHAYGTGELLNEAQLKKELSMLLNRYESNHINGATWENLSEKTKQQVNGIIGFKVKVDKLEAAYKLSQNRSQKEKENIMKHLKQTGAPLNSQLADAIKDQQ
ncbi:FMN-binding negative transcriptional regulator [Staphylococcus pseudoxylosus]|uniref:FMN-binding negative transcriptional regulator n=1 Tax=Staphylococcus pseudoxylosus TaxID=2282419 RepID=UPI001BDA0F5B|nr:FMN-binding negative transcriptional regulator [Staphylococcus pseudoxylosus]MEB6169562.1 FMN-binding negative transcriptional regulator [Staphylococcus pseudoxylosus]